MHRRIYAMETPWAQHLEGSYVRAKLLRRTDWSQVPFFYLDNGAQEFVWDSHCNTAVVRWLLREHGRVLAGPHPRTLVDRVSAAELQREGLASVQEYAEWAREPIDKDPMSRWKRAYLVLTLCRLLFTLAEGGRIEGRSRRMGSRHRLRRHESSAVGSRAPKRRGTVDPERVPPPAAPALQRHERENTQTRPRLGAATLESVRARAPAACPAVTVSRAFAAAPQARASVIRSEQCESRGP
jgi:hypothetical protein